VKTQLYLAGASLDTKFILLVLVSNSVLIPSWRPTKIAKTIAISSHFLPPVADAH